MRKKSSLKDKVLIIITLTAFFINTISIMLIEQSSREWINVLVSLACLSWILLFFYANKRRFAKV